MAWGLRTLLGAAAAMTAGAALACGATPCANPDGGRWGDGGSQDWTYEDGFRSERSYAYEGRYESVREYRDERRWREGEGEVVLPSSFFIGAGGVGPIPSDTYYGGGYWIMGGSGFAGAHAAAFASARAAASARVSVHVSGRGGVCCH